MTDERTQPRTHPLARLAIAAIRLYQWTLSPIIGRQCRFHPTCSHYAIDAFRHHPPIRAAKLTLRRLTKCHPLHPGGYDPVP